MNAGTGQSGRCPHTQAGGAGRFATGLEFVHNGFMRNIPPPLCRAAGALLALLALGLSGPAMAQADASPGVFVEIGFGSGDTRSGTVGLSWPWRQQWALGSGQLSGHWDAYVSHWRSPATADPGAHEGLTQIALVPVLRWRSDQGRSPWFVEGGIGVSLMDARYRTPRKQFSTRFNFADHLAVGRDFGAQWRHELALRLQHVSNGDIRKPNPGENFVQLRYSLAF